ncbi:response regulator transcription factor [Labrenzia sp. R4_2]|nr:response regulator transcription factor [Labrenzia sp. R4_2]
MDLNLPDCRGAEALKSIANKFPGQEVLVVTGNLDKHLSQTLLEIGTVDVLDKSTITKGESQNAIMAALRVEAGTY